MVIRTLARELANAQQRAMRLRGGGNCPPANQSRKALAQTLF
jgi:hypothetical protein